MNEDDTSWITDPFHKAKPKPTKPHQPPVRELYNRRLQILLTAGQAEKLQEKSLQKGLSISHLIRNLINEHL